MSEEANEVDQALQEVRGALDRPGYLIITSKHENAEGAEKLPDETRNALLVHVNAWRGELQRLLGRDGFPETGKLSAAVVLVTMVVTPYLAFLKDPKTGFGHRCETEATSQWLVIVSTNLQFILGERERSP